MGLGDEAWGHYAFFHEPLERKLSKEQKASYTKLAMKCGREEGVLLKQPIHKRRCWKLPVIWESGWKHRTFQTVAVM